MNGPKPLKNKILSTARLIKYVCHTPGLTASQLGRLLNKPYGTISSHLYHLSKNGKLARKVGFSATTHNTAWRYYPNDCQ